MNEENELNTQVEGFLYDIDALNEFSQLGEWYIFLNDEWMPLGKTTKN